MRSVSPSFARVSHASNTQFPIEQPPRSSAHASVPKSAASAKLAPVGGHARMPRRHSHRQILQSEPRASSELHTSYLRRRSTLSGKMPSSTASSVASAESTMPLVGKVAFGGDKSDLLRWRRHTVLGGTSNKKETEQKDTTVDEAASIATSVASCTLQNQQRTSAADTPPHHRLGMTQLCVFFGNLPPRTSSLALGKALEAALEAEPLDVWCSRERTANGVETFGFATFAAQAVAATAKQLPIPVGNTHVWGEEVTLSSHASKMPKFLLPLVCAAPLEGRQLHVSQVPRDTNTNAVHAVFAQFGDVVMASVLRGRGNGGWMQRRRSTSQSSSHQTGKQSLTYAYVTFATRAGADRALQHARRSSIVITGSTLRLARAHRQNVWMAKKSCGQRRSSLSTRRRSSVKEE
ncbi:MAG: hypothetical protein MHM6MM_003389 [Cercozoa sp. M6MM]